MNYSQKASDFSPEEYREFISYLLDRIEDPAILYHILAIVNDIFCRN